MVQKVDHREGDPGSWNLTSSLEQLVVEEDVTVVEDPFLGLRTLDHTDGGTVSSSWVLAA